MVLSSRTYTMVPKYESPTDGAYSDSSPFVRLFGTPSRAKILDVFLRKHYEELTAADVKTLSGVSKSSFHRNVDELETLGIIEQTGTVGNSRTYRLNKESELAKTLAKAHSDILGHSMEILDDTQDPLERAMVAALNDPNETQDTDRETRRMTRQIAESLTG